MNKLKEFCPQPFYRVEIYQNGDVYTCCEAFIKFNIGNIYETPFEQIWNGEKVKSIREKLLNSDFCFCSDLCKRKNEKNIIEPYHTIEVKNYPTEISVSSDNSCNIRCIFCRDEYKKTEYDKEKLDTEIKNIWLPIFKDAKVLTVGTTGEPFASYKELYLIKEVAKTYPNLKFHFHTNGILGTEEKLKELNLYNKIDSMTVSLHSASKWTYNKIVKGGNYNQVIKNIKLYSEMKQKGIINNLRLVFVVYSENYKEMPKFVKFAQKNNAVVEFWALRKFDNTKMSEEFDKFSVLNQNNKCYNNLKKILKNSIFQSNNVILYPELKQILDR